MDLNAENKILQIVADGGSINSSIWPELVSRLIPRIKQIAHNDFPIPTLQQSLPSHRLSSPQRPIATPAKVASQSESISSQNTASSSQLADKENAPPTSIRLAKPDNDEMSNTLPPQVLSLLNSIAETLTTYFSVHPPHTIQRLAELILAPRNHYRTLFSYLHAVDRVVHVTSGANIYPLPAAIQDPRALPNGTGSNTDPNSISWGNSTTTVPSLGSDESLGGALLTPIPWLRSQNQVATSNGNGNLVRELAGELKTESTETIDGPNGAGSIETVSISVNGIPSTTLSSTTANKNGGGNLRADGGVTQGELLRQEQRAGVVPAAQLTIPRGSADMEGMNGEEDDEMPHARGPEEIGMEDTGPQASGGIGIAMQGIDVEAAVGRRTDETNEEPVPTTPKREAEEELGSETKRARDEAPTKTELQEENQSMVLVDADVKDKTGDQTGEVGEDAGSATVGTAPI